MQVKRFQGLETITSFQLCYPLSRTEISGIDEMVSLIFEYAKGRMWCLDYFEGFYDLLGTDFVLLFL
jgi:hypothetical protein